MVKHLEKTSEAIGQATAWLSVLMVLMMTLVVILRYVFNLGWIALQESVMYLHSAVFMVGASYTLKQDGHVRVDVFYRQFSPKTKALINLLGHVLFLLPFCMVVLWSSWDYVLDSWEIREASREAGGIAFVYGLKTLLLVMPVLLLLEGCLRALGCYAELSGAHD